MTGGRGSHPHAAGAVLTAVMFAFIVAGLGWFCGGQALLGRIDPALVIPTLFLPALMAAYLVRHRERRWRWRSLAVCALLSVLMQAGLSLWLARYVDPAQTAVAGAATVLALALADAFWSWRSKTGQRRILTAGAVFAMLCGGFVGGHMALAGLYAHRTPATPLPDLILMSSLPLRWGGTDDIRIALQLGLADDPALARLEQDFHVTLADNLASLDRRAPQAVLLAHPRALPPGELVAIDHFVQGGGRAILLADALSSWPSEHPLGDPRNPPVTSLLTPLLDHWGVRLGSADLTDHAPISFDLDGQRVTLVSAGRFDMLPPTCRTEAQRHVAHCAIGAGQVWLVGDADMLFAPLWQPALPGAAHLRRADTMEWLAGLITGPEARTGGLLHPVWQRVGTAQSR